MYFYNVEREPSDIDILTNNVSKLVDKVVNNRLTDRQKQMESDNQYFKAEMFASKQMVRDMRYKIDEMQKDVDNAIDAAKKVAQREYFFDCAIGDTVYVVDNRYTRGKCKRCEGTHKLRIKVDGIEVEAECPICGSYNKSRRFEYFEPVIVEGKISTINIQLYGDKKQITVWLDKVDREYKIDDKKCNVFRTREEAEPLYQTKLKELEERLHEIKDYIIPKSESKGRCSK